MGTVFTSPGVFRRGNSSDQTVSGKSLQLTAQWIPVKVYFTSSGQQWVFRGNFPDLEVKIVWQGVFLNGKCHMHNPRRSAFIWVPTMCIVSFIHCNNTVRLVLLFPHKKKNRWEIKAQRWCRTHSCTHSCHVVNLHLKVIYSAPELWWQNAIVYLAL